MRVDDGRLFVGKSLSEVAHDLLDALLVGFDVVAAIGPYSDAVSHAVAILDDKPWTTLRTTRKSHGTENMLEGHVPVIGERILLLHDDTVDVTDDPAVTELLGTGAEIVIVVTIVTPMVA